MVKESKSPTTASKKNHSTKSPRSLAIFERGIETGAQFAQAMSALMSDLISGTITPNVGNAVCNAGGKLLKVVEMQHKYGTSQPDGTKVMQLTI